MKRMISLFLTLLLLLTGCAEKPAYSESSEPISIVDESAILGAAPDSFPAAVASGTAVKKSEKAVIDYSNTADGYVMVRYLAKTDKRLKAQVKGPGGTTYTYNLTAGAPYATFPLSDGNGSYQVTVYENISGTSYANVLSVGFAAQLADEFAPFLMPNQYVNYSAGSAVVKKGEELAGKISDPLEKVQAIYHYVVTNFSYDKKKADTVQSGYLPVLDTVLKEKKGICFDYAAVMTAMLRSQKIPTKLVVGYSGTIYHAWINVYSEESGWITGAIFFDGTTWKLMDPTFASGAKESKKMMDYIGNSANYSAKYIY